MAGKLKPTTNFREFPAFRWRRDSAGYQLSADQTRIEGLGGALIEYDPAKQNPRSSSRLY